MNSEEKTKKLRMQEKINKPRALNLEEGSKGNKKRKETNNPTPTDQPEVYNICAGS